MRVGSGALLLTSSNAVLLHASHVEALEEATGFALLPIDQVHLTLAGGAVDAAEGALSVGVPPEEGLTGVAAQPLEVETGRLVGAHLTALDQMVVVVDHRLS